MLFDKNHWCTLGVTEGILYTRVSSIGIGDSCRIADPVGIAHLCKDKYPNHHIWMGGIVITDPPQSAVESTMAGDMAGGEYCFVSTNRVQLGVNME